MDNSFYDNSFYTTQLLPFEEKELGSLRKFIIDKLDKKSKALESKKTQYHEKVKKIYEGVSFWEKTLISRHPERLHFLDYSESLFSSFIELHGDRYFGDDRAIIGGIAKFEGQSVMAIGHEKGKLETMIEHNFGMGNPEGYRKALRLFKLADKFNLPIITFIDTPGAYPGIGAEERGQSEAIARNLQEMFTLTVPIIAIVTGEGGSGGALGLAIGNKVAMLEHSIYSVISPESCASILWRDHTKKELAAQALKNDAKTALTNGVIDEIIKEPLGGVHRQRSVALDNLKQFLLRNLSELTKLSKSKIITHREEKFAQMGL